MALVQTSQDVALAKYDVWSQLRQVPKEHCVHPEYCSAQAKHVLIEVR